MSKKGTKALASATLMSLVLTTALSAGPVKAAQGSVTRIGEADRYATAAKVATTNWTTSDDVVLVCGEGYADAVSASALAKKLNAPILLTTAGSLSTDSASALKTLKAKNIYIVGGNASVSQAIRADLKKNYNLIELGGSNRYETNVAVAQKLVDLGVKADEVMMVGGEGFSDALSVAPIASAKGQILLLGMNDADHMKPVIDFVKKNNSKVTVVGTKNVISDAILNTVNGTRVDGGNDRFDTNLKVLGSFKDAIKMEKLYVANASGDGYADALVASALAGKATAPLVLVDKEGASATANAISYIGKNATKTTDLNVVGGTGVVSNGVVESINKAVNNGKPSNPSVQSIEVVSLNQIKVHFNAAIDSDSAEDIENYKIDGTQLKHVNDKDEATDENCAVASAIDDNTVLITLAKPRKQYDNVTISVKKAILTADQEDTIASFDQTVTFSDTKVPTLKSVVMEGNSQITVEFSEAINMGKATDAEKVINELKSKFKIDGQSIGNYGVNTEWSEVKDKIMVTNGDYGKVGTWANKVQFYLDSAIPSGNHTLKISDGETDGVLCDAAGFPFKEASEEFTVDTMTTKPEIKSVKEAVSGEVHITFDRPMDKQTAKDPKYYKINDKKVSEISGYQVKLANNDTVVKLKHVGSEIKTGSNTVDISNSIKDAFGNKVPDDTRKSFDDIKDDTKPTVKSISIIDSETIRVKFSKDVDFQYASNTSNYKLQDNKNVDITDHIRGIFNTAGESDTGNSSTFNIKLKKYSDDGKEDWRLTGSKYTLTIKNIRDTASTPNIMEDYTYTLNGTDDVAPKGTGIFGKKGIDGDKDKVIIYFSESMDSSTLTNKDNYKFKNGEGDTKSLPGDATISSGGDDKSAIIEFPKSYHVRLSNDPNKNTYTSTNDVMGVTVTNVKDVAGNVLDSVAYNNDNKIDEAKAGAKVKEKTVRTWYDVDDFKVDVQFDKALDEVSPEDFTFGGVHPDSAPKNGDKVTLIFKDGSLPKATDVAPEIAYANGLKNANPTKIDLIKAQGQNAKLDIVSVKTTDETGAKISRNDDGSVAILKDYQAKAYNYEAAPRTTCSKDTDADFWTATKDANGGIVYLTFDTPLDKNSGIKSDDFTFNGLNGSSIKPDNVEIDGMTVKFIFDKNNKDISKFTGKIDISAKSTVNLRTQKDLNGENANYKPSDKDIKTRTITVSNLVVAADKTALNASIAAAEAKVQADYTADSWTAMQPKLAAAKTVAAKADAAQVDVDAAKTNLDAAVTGLVKVTDTTVAWVTAPKYLSTTTTINGTVDAAKVTKVTYSVNGGAETVVTIDATGAFSVDASAIAEGTKVVVKAYDASNNVVNSTEVLRAV